MNAVDLLVTDHRRMESLLKALVEAGGDEKAKRFTEVADTLATHVAIEEKIFYPAVKASRTEDILLESLEEHLSIKRVLADLIALSPSDDTFDPKLHVLKEQVEHHHKEEEGDLFPKVRKLLSHERLSELGEAMEAEQKKLQAGKPRCAVLGQTGEAASV
ncbi:MAG: hemerythrin domain-containing protein [Polyangiaceae bacterium]|nr:hemerythrin domain-containing protein [Polyangiaceae bacterium]NUQ74752.1 hemerythrin domain-containing protein [Polyangiaceae bacterium]